MNQSELTYLEKSIAGVVRRALEEKLEMYEEVWLTADQMQQYFGAIKKSWLDRYGHSLPHRDLKVKDERGIEHKSARQYPRNQIQRMFANGEIERLVCKAVVT
jgi:hypothetical protein